MRTADDTRDGFEEAFREWDDSATISHSQIAPLAQGSQPYARSLSPRTATRSYPPTTGRLARGTRPPFVAQTLEEALLALADGVPERLPA
jgi:hypothetical protein